MERFLAVGGKDSSDSAEEKMIRQNDHAVVMALNLYTNKKKPRKRGFLWLSGDDHLRHEHDHVLILLY